MTKPNRLLQANLALALAMIPSYLFFTFVPDAIQHFNAWREALHLSLRNDVFIGISVFWWVPALLVFAFMRYTHFEHWLKVNLLAHLSILVANLFLLLLVGLTVYHNTKDYVYALAHDRDVILFYTLSFAAMLSIVNMAWHYIVVPNPKLRAWLIEDTFSPFVK